MPKNPIFKVNKLSDKNVTETIYVFFGSQFSEEIEDPNDLFEDLINNLSNPPNTKFYDYIIKNVFKKDKELVYIKENKIEVIFINQSIHIYSY